jgi:hypothetical protein
MTIHTLQPTLASPLDSTIGNQPRRIIGTPHHAVSGLCREDTSTRHIRSCSTAVDTDTLFEVKVLHSSSDDALCLSRSNRRVEGLDVRVGEGSVSVIQSAFLVLERKFAGLLIIY